MIQMFVDARRARAQKNQMLCVTLAPCADDGVQPHPETSLDGDGLFERMRREARHLCAIRREIPNPGNEALLKQVEDFHSDT